MEVNNIEPVAQPEIITVSGIDTTVFLSTPSGIEMRFGYHTSTYQVQKFTLNKNALDSLKNKINKKQDLELKKMKNE